MKEVMSRALLAFVVGSLLLTGCSITPTVAETKNKAARVAAATTTPVFDGVAATVAVVDSQEIDPKTGQNTGVWKRSVHLFNNLPTGSELLKTAVGAVVPAYIQGEAAKDVAKIGRCVSGNCGGTVINAVSGSLSEATNLNQIGVGVTTGVPCGTACGADWAK